MRSSGRSSGTTGTCCLTFSAPRTKTASQRWTTADLQPNGTQTMERHKQQAPPPLLCDWLLAVKGLISCPMWRFYCEGLLDPVFDVWDESWLSVHGYGVVW